MSPANSKLPCGSPQIPTGPYSRQEVSRKKPEILQRARNTCATHARVHTHVCARVCAKIVVSTRRQ
jgi:hypothetical protein